MSQTNEPINLSGLNQGTTVPGIPFAIESAHKQKITIVDAASERFLFKLVENNNLNDGNIIKGIARELKELNIAPSYAEAIIHNLQKVQLLETSNQKYNELYTALIIALSSVDFTFGKKSPLLRKLYMSIFASNLLLMEEISKQINFQKMYGIDAVPPERFALRVQKILGQETVGLYDDEGIEYSNIGVLHPQGTLGKVRGVIGINYAPQQFNNIPYVYSSIENAPQRLRIGTQIEQTFVTPSVPSIFKNFLKALHIDQSGDEPVNYLYINLQKNSKKSTDGIERQAEALRTHTLHEELGKIPGVAIVTLPADNSSFFQGFSKHEGKSLICGNKQDFVPLNTLFEEICTSIFENSDDFIIPDSIKIKIFGPDHYNSVHKIKERLQELFNSAAKEMLGNDVSTDQLLSMEQRQAVYFHFVKHKFTKLLLDSLKPKYFNISCKDAIDRAGVHNLWSILCSRLDENKAMSLQEFEMLLNMPAILVKDRPVNDHVNVLSNALGQLFFHLPEEKKQLIPWAPAWLKINTCWSKQEQDVSTIFTWRYDHIKTKQQYFSYHQMNYNALYSAVSDGDEQKVAELLAEPSQLSIFDNDQNKGDTVLMCAANNGKFDIFLKLLDAHDKFESTKSTFSHNPLANLRSNYGKNSGCILGVLLKCIETESVDIESNEQNVSLAEICIERYLESILKTQGAFSTKVHKDYSKYNTPDQNGLTPIFHLAQTGNYQLLAKIASMLSEIRQLTITDFFAIDSKTKKSLIELAMKGGGEHHQLFVQTMLTLTNSSEEERMDYLKESSSISKADNTTPTENDIFLQSLLERDPKSKFTVAAIVLMKYLKMDNNVISPEWVACVQEATDLYGKSNTSWLNKNVSTDPYISSIFASVCGTGKLEANNTKDSKYEMIKLRIQIEIELEKNKHEFSEVIENIKKCHEASSYDVLTKVNVTELTEAYKDSATLQYSDESNRHDAATKLIAAYKKVLIVAITKDPDTSYRLDALVFDIDRNKFKAVADVENLVKLAKKLYSLETMNGYYLTLYAELAKLFKFLPINNGEQQEQYDLLREQYDMLLKEHGVHLPHDIFTSFEKLFVQSGQKVTKLSIKD